MQERKKNSAIKNEKGQVALFVALIFQVLFVFFAMLINVGLLVHHKINLQNSVDLAAYYAASKQAEMLNAIAHVNYQIRQSWKLLTFRYRHLGSYGADNYAGRPQGTVQDSSDAAGSVVPAFCVTYTPFMFMGANENKCRQSGAQGPWILNHPPVNSMVADPLGFGSFQSGIIAAQQAVRSAMEKDCKIKKALSLFALTEFILGYKQDIANRKQLLIGLARRMSKSDSNFNDLDGESVTDGVKSTLLNNLTYQNKDSLKVKFFNSLGANGCGAGGDNNTPPDWIKEIFIYPVFWAYLGECTTEMSAFVATPVNASSGNAAITAAVQQAIAENPAMGNFLKNTLDIIKEPNGSAPPERRLMASSMGFEKNPWCMGYVGVQATATPQIPFSLPFQQVTLKATAYAKPFGGSIGPWNGNKWQSGAPESDRGTEVQKVGPPRINLGDPWADDKDPRLAADAVRYVGDEIGTKSNMNMANFSKLISTTFNAGTMDLNWWGHIQDPQSFKDTGDIMAWGDTQYAKKMRDIEVVAIAPDNFDSAYYSVEPDFHRNYYLRLKKQEGTLGRDLVVRGDLGQRIGDSSYGTFSIRDQINVFSNYTSNRLGFHIQKFEELLTSFKANAPDEQGSLPNPSLNFGKCQDPIPDDAPTEKATTGNCRAGGRLGYSVKLVDGEFLNASDLPLGGPGSTGPLKNPPPEPSAWTDVP